MEYNCEIGNYPKYLHIVCFDKYCYLFKETKGLKTIKKSKRFIDVYRYALHLQSKNRLTIMVHNEDGMPIKLYKPRIKEIRFQRGKC